MRRDCDSCKHTFGEACCDECICGNPPTKWEAALHYVPDTHAEVMREMTDEELAKFLMSDWFAGDVCKNCEGSYDRCGDVKFCELKILEWLQEYIDEPGDFYTHDDNCLECERDIPEECSTCKYKIVG